MNDQIRRGPGRPAKSQGNPMLTTSLSVDTADQQVHDAVTDDRPDENQQWRRVSNLEAPPERPGYSQCWIRTHIRGEEDTGNVSKKLREGWRPRLASSVPEGHSPPTISYGHYGNVVGVYGMILCEMPARMKAQRDAYYKGLAKQAEAQVDRQLDQYNVPGKVRMTMKTRSEVEFVKGESRFQDDTDDD